MTKQEAIKLGLDLGTEVYRTDLSEVIPTLVYKIYNDFEKELKQAWIDGSDATYKALKEAGKLK